MEGINVVIKKGSGIRKKSKGERELGKQDIGEEEDMDQSMGQRQLNAPEGVGDGGKSLHTYEHFYYDSYK